MWLHARVQRSSEVELGPTRGPGIGQTSGLWARTCVCASLSTPVSLNCGDQPHLPTLQAETVWAPEPTPGNAGESSTGGDGRGTDGPRPRPQERPRGSRWPPRAEDRHPTPRGSALPAAGRGSGGQGAWPPPPSLLTAAASVLVASAAQSSERIPLLIQQRCSSWSNLVSAQ